MIVDVASVSSGRYRLEFRCTVGRVDNNNSNNNNCNNNNNNECYNSSTHRHDC